MFTNLVFNSVLMSNKIMFYCKPFPHICFLVFLNFELKEGKYYLVFLEVYKE